MDRNTRNVIAASIVILVIIAVVFTFIRNNQTTPADISGTASTTEQTPGTTTGGSTNGNTTNSISDGTIKIVYPTADFGLATNSQQILATSYIPPCDAGFNYCVYYTGTAYTGTNFESAGMSVDTRSDLSTERTCLNTPPDGYAASVTPTGTKAGTGYSSSVFSNIGDAAAGHTASGSLYRLFIQSTSKCYEFGTRIGQTQFANYPAGTIKEFTTANQTSLAGELKAILETITLPSGQSSLFS